MTVPRDSSWLTNFFRTRGHRLGFGLHRPK